MPPDFFLTISYCTIQILIIKENLSIRLHLDCKGFFLESLSKSVALGKSVC